MFEALAALFDPMVEPLRGVFRPYYLILQFIHVLSVMIWAFSTTIAYGWYVRVVYLRWERDPDDPERRRRRNWAMEQLDSGVAVEHVAFPTILVTGLLLFIAGGWSVDGQLSWLLVKLGLVVLVFLPMEILDYWLSHLGGNKRRIRQSGDMERYERAMAHHWLFLRVTTPIVVTLIPFAIYLAIVKPF